MKWTHNVVPVKVKLSLRLIKHEATKKFEEVEAQLLEFLTVTLDGSGWADLRAGCCNSGEGARVNQRVG
jgi:hypothetical protein